VRKPLDCHEWHFYCSHWSYISNTGARNGLPPSRLQQSSCFENCQLHFYWLTFRWSADLEHWPYVSLLSTFFELPSHFHFYASRTQEKFVLFSEIKINHCFANVWLRKAWNRKKFFFYLGACLRNSTFFPTILYGPPRTFPSPFYLYFTLT